MNDIFWITRPYKDALEVAETIQKLGYTPYIEPLLNIVKIPLNLDNHTISSIDSVVLTSANALDETEQTAYVPLLDKKVFCVGERTAKAALDLGFQKVIQGAGDILHLKNVIKEGTDIKHILYLRGREITSPFILEDIKVTEFITYKAEYVLHLSNTLIGKIRQKDINHILLFSIRTGECLLEHIKTHELEPYMRSVTIGCLSEKIADILKEIEWKLVVIAQQPTTKNLLTCYNKLMKCSNSWLIHE